MNSYFIKEFIFAKYKNRCVGNARKFKAMIKKKYGDIDAGEIYRRIINYQVKKYGESLSEGVDMGTSPSKLRNRVRCRERHRRAQLGIEKNTKIKRWTDEEVR